MCGAAVQSIMSVESPVSASPNAPAAPRSAREVIDAAIAENRVWERVCLGLTVAFASVGVAVIGIGAARSDGLLALAGSVSGTLFWPALRNAVAIRRVNIAIRLLEVPLGQARTTQQAADAIREAFVFHFGRGNNDVAVPP